jgi:hypothetical protein
MTNQKSASGKISKSVIQGLRPAKLHENESKPLHVFNGLAHISDPAVVNRKREAIWPVTS